LLDEIEKANPDVFNILLQIMEDGRLTDGQGRTVNFKNTILLMTSNLDAAELKNRFRPEFLNRIDETLIFHPLDQKDLRKIVDIQLARVLARLKDRRVAVLIEDEAKDYLAREGYDPAFGARPLKRSIQKLLVDPLARMLLTGEVRDGDALEVSTSKGGLVFKAARKKDSKAA
jgi:ATP-dependent Clp protease ATP-binding subunit ClpB